MSVLQAGAVVMCCNTATLRLDRTSRTPISATRHSVISSHEDPLPRPPPVFSLAGHVRMTAVVQFKSCRNIPHSTPPPPPWHNSRKPRNVCVNQDSLHQTHIDQTSITAAPAFILRASKHAHPWCAALGRNTNFEHKCVQCHCVQCFFLHRGVPVHAVWSTRRVHPLCNPQPPPSDNLSPGHDPPSAQPTFW